MRDSYVSFTEWPSGLLSRRRTFAIPDIDDTIFSQGAGEHLSHLKLVLSVIGNAGKWGSMVNGNFNFQSSDIDGTK